MRWNLNFLNFDRRGSEFDMARGWHVFSTRWIHFSQIQKSRSSNQVNETENIPESVCFDVHVHVTETRNVTRLKSRNESRLVSFVP